MQHTPTFRTCVLSVKRSDVQLRLAEAKIAVAVVAAADTDAGDDDDKDVKEGEEVSTRDDLERIPPMLTPPWSRDPCLVAREPLPLPVVFTSPPPLLALAVDAPDWAREMGPAAGDNDGLKCDMSRSSVPSKDKSESNDVEAAASW